MHLSPGAEKPLHCCALPSCQVKEQSMYQPVTKVHAQVLMALHYLYVHASNVDWPEGGI